MDAARLAVIQGSIISQTNGFAYFSQKKSRSNRRFILMFKSCLAINNSHNNLNEKLTFILFNLKHLTQIRQERLVITHGFT